MAANTPGKQADVRLGISYGRQSTQLFGLPCAMSRRPSSACWPPSRPPRLRQSTARKMRDPTKAATTSRSEMANASSPAKYQKDERLRRQSVRRRVRCRGSRADIVRKPSLLSTNGATPTLTLTFNPSPAQGDGQSAPASTQALIRAPNSCCVPGTGARPTPGCQPQPTSESSPMW
jgi:hypothetical protein